MREILFRGKRKYSEENEWVYGFLGRETYHNETDYVISDVQVWEDAKLVFKSAGDTWAVLEETVGQYTGLQDKRGTKVFEGDILESLDDKTFLFVVRYGEYGNRNDESKKHIGFYCDWISCHGLNPLNGLAFNAGKYKVVGNIHDNPELIEK